MRNVINIYNICKNFLIMYVILTCAELTAMDQRVDPKPGPSLAFHAGGDSLSVLKEADPDRTKLAVNPKLYNSFQPSSMKKSLEHQQLVMEKSPIHFIGYNDPNEAYEQFWISAFKSQLLCEVFEQTVDGVSGKVIKKSEGSYILEYLQKSKRTPIAAALCTFQMADHSVATDLAIGAEWIDHTVQVHGQSSILFLGRSPCFVQVAYEELLRTKYKYTTEQVRAQCIHLNFSGTPDAVSLRTSKDFENDAIDFCRNVITDGRLAYYMNYLTHVGLDRVKDKLYIVDVISMGVSLNCALRILRYFYTTYLKYPTMPDVHFICLSMQHGLEKTVTTSKEIKNYPEIKPGSIIWSYNPSKEIITFEDNRKLGIWPLTIRTTTVNLANFVYASILDGDLFQHILSHGSYMPAYRWNSQFETEIAAAGRLHKKVYPMMRGILSSAVQELELEIQKKVHQS
jgi:hypothetical protein